MPPIKPKDLDSDSEPRKLAAYLSGLAASGMHEHGHGAAVESVREDEFKGHHIVVRTTYSLEVDGRVLEVPLMVDNDGNVRCHSLPNYQFVSAIDLVHQLIDTYPDEFKKDSPPAPGAGSSPSTGRGHGPESAHGSPPKRSEKKRSPKTGGGN